MSSIYCVLNHEPTKTYLSQIHSGRSGSDGAWMIRINLYDLQDIYQPFLGVQFTSCGVIAPSYKPIGVYDTNNLRQFGVVVAWGNSGRCVLIVNGLRPFSICSHTVKQSYRGLGSIPRGAFLLFFSFLIVLSGFSPKGEHSRPLQAADQDPTAPLLPTSGQASE